jgi:hypothetical protein
MLEASQGITETKGHDLEFVVTISGVEGSFPFFARGYAD